MEFTVFETAKRSKVSTSERVPAEVDGWILFLPPSAKKDGKWDDALGFLSATERADLAGYVKRFGFKPKAEQVASFDQSAARRTVLSVLPDTAEMFFYLETARKGLEPLREAKARRIAVDLRACSTGAALLAEAVVAANAALAFEAKQYGEESKEDKEDKAPFPELIFVAPRGTVLDLSALRSTVETACGTDLVRYLSGLAGNDLTPTRYVALATKLAKEHGLKTVFHSLEKLEKLKAGAFLAVAQASDDRGAGILKISYTPSKASKRVALVGKGITFDTGGTQLKAGEHMFGMNGDMGGSAVALALVLLAQKQKWPWEVHAYLAIAENAIGPKSYKPNDIVKTMRGKTIEVVDSDAEGRMVLSDTLWLAGKDKPDLMMDFATLTGACLRAIGTSFSGAYSNRPDWIGKIIDSGKRSGERVWPFPGDADYGRCLKSDIADLKQCRLTGGSDHIEAGYFLSQFIPEKTPWLHVDLSAAESEEGLAHVPSKITGFGVRFASEFLRSVLEA